MGGKWWEGSDKVWCHGSSQEFEKSEIGEQVSVENNAEERVCESSGN